MSKQRHIPAIERKAEVLAAAVALAERVGYTHLIRDQIAVEAKCSTGLVTQYFGTLDCLKRAVVSHAIHTENLLIIAQALAARHPKAQRAPEDLRRRAALHSAGL
jgi:AcrR family transcriptional regulator